ncbi:MAG: helix-turn-helix domain-containing protein [Candidatus Dormibacteria bacterium]
MSKLLVRVEEAADLLGIGRTMAWRLVYTGDIPTVLIGRRRLVPMLALEEYVHKLTASHRGEELS